MMGRRDGEGEDAAAAWVIRLRDPGFADWEAFTAWLEADPRHNALYEEAALADRRLDGVLVAGPEPASNDNPARAAAPRRGKIAGWSAAAALLVAMAGYPLLRHDSPAYAIETAPGEQRSVTLADGTRVDLNGGTRLTFRRGDVRLASLDRGEATFTVAHDQAHPFIVDAGGSHIRDLGTVFDVTHGEGAVEVGVSEGEVVYDPAGDPVHLKAGQTLRVTGAGRMIGRSAPASIGTWRSGRLVYRDAPLSRVAGDVSRYLGVSVTAAPAIAQRPFNGVIILDHDAGLTMGRLAPLLGVEAQPAQHGWRLTALTRETR